MRGVVAALCVGLLVAPAFAQAPGSTQIEAEARPLLDRYIALFNKGDAAALAKDVYTGANEAALARQVADLRADSFGKLDVYEAAFCSVDATHGKALMKFARIYTFGGKMNDDEAKVFDLLKTPDGWRISSEAETPFDKPLSC